MGEVASTPPPPLYVQGLKQIAFHYQAYFSEIVAIYCMISTDRQHHGQLVYSINLLKQVVSITTEQDLSVTDLFHVKFSGTDKMSGFFTRIGPQIWNSVLYSIKTLKRSSFRRKIKKLLVDFLRSKDDYVEVLHLSKLFNKLS